MADDIFVILNDTYIHHICTTSAPPRATPHASNASGIQGL